jgi:arginine decarboxylase
MTWTEQDAAELYAMASWSDGYFSVNAAGNVAVRPNRTSEHEIDLYEVVEGLRARDLSTPVVVRISGIIADRVRRLHDAVRSAIVEYA